MAERVSLSVRGKTYEGWKEIRLQRSIKAMAGSFSLSLTDNWSAELKPWILIPGDECEVKSNGQTLIRGYIDEVETSYDAKQRELSVSGREITADMVDCSARYTANTEFSGITLLALAEKLAKPFGIAVRDDSGNKKAIEKVAISTGETPHQVLDKAARQLGLLVTSNGRGTLIIQKIGQSTAPAKLIEGENILSASASFSVKNRFSEYLVLSQNNEEGLDPSLQAASSGTAYDKEIGRNRLLVLQAEQSSTPDLCQVRAKWEAAHRRGESVQVNLKAQGWRLSDGSLFEPNRLYRITSPWIGIDEELLLEEIGLSVSQQGTISSLKFSRKDAYLPDSAYKADGADLLKKLIQDNQKKEGARNWMAEKRPVWEGTDS